MFFIIVIDGRIFRDVIVAKKLCVPAGSHIFSILRWPFTKPVGSRNAKLMMESIELIY